MAVNITTDTNTVKVTSTATNKVAIVDNAKNTSVTVSQPVTRVVKVATVGPQGQAGIVPNTGSFATTGSNTFTGDQVISGSLQVTQGITGSLFGTASFADLSTTASYAVTASYADLALTASYASTASFSLSASLAELATTASYAVSSSYATTASYAGLSTTASYSLSASLALTASYASTASFSLSASLAELATTASYAGLSTTASYSLSASLALTASYASTASFSEIATTASYAVSALLAQTASLADLATTASYASTASYAPSYLPLTGGTITGNLNVIGTASFVYSTASIVQVGSNTIILNTDNPATRFGGITVVDSGSFGNSSTGSLFWDSQNNRWIYANPSGSTYDGGLLISGPRNTSGLGNEQGTTANALMKGQGGDHITSSAVFEVSGSVGIGTSTPNASLHVSGSTTATSAIARGVNFSNTLVASANSDVLVGLDIAPTFTNGAFTGISQIGLRVGGNINTSGQYTNINANNYTTAPIALRTIGVDISGISIYKASFGHTNSIQFLSNNLNNRFSIGQGYIGVSDSIDFTIARFASSTWSDAFRIFNATGNISINGTADNGGKLQIVAPGTGSTDIALRVRNNANTADLVFIDGAGNFNIGGSAQSGYQVRVSNNGYFGGALRVDGSSTFNAGLTVVGATILTGGQTTVRDGNSLLVGGIAGQFANTSALVEVRSTIKGLLPPRTDLTSNISTPAQGLITYLTGSTNEGLYYHNSGSQIGWHKVLTNTGSQSITGSLLADTVNVNNELTIKGTNIQSLMIAYSVALG